MRQYLFFLLLFLFNPVLGQKSERQGWYVKNYSEKYARAYFDSSNSLDKIEGIWQSTDGFKYAIEKNVSSAGRIKNKYRIIILESSVNGWEPTEIKGFIDYVSINDVYSMKYYTKASYDGSNLSSENVFLVFENPLLMSFQRLDGVKISLVKLYPKVSKSKEEQNSFYSTPAPQWTGSCVAIGNKLVVTNYHVVENANNLVVSGINGDQSVDYAAEVVLTDKFNDLAVVKVKDYRFNGFNIKYGIKKSVSDIGTNVFVLGYPLTSTMGDDIKLTTGVISSKTGFQGDVSQYQISAPVQPGNSGGPLFDDMGNLIGIVSAKHRGAENVGYAIKLSYLQNLVDSSNEPIELNTFNSISSLPLPEKVKAISPCVLLIKANTVNNSYSKRNEGGYIGRESTEERMSKAQSLLDSANEKYQNGDVDGAYVDACKSVEIYPNPVNHFRKGYLASVLDSIDSVIESIEYCLRHNHRTEVCYEILSSAYVSKGNWEKALEFSEKVIENDRKNITALEISGICKSELGRKDDAISDYIKAIRFDGVIDYNYANIYNNLAYEYMKKSNYTKAKEYIDKSIQHSHMYGNAWDTYGELNYRLGNYDQCIDCMNKSITISKLVKKDSWSGNSFLYRGLARKKIGDVYGAYTDLEISLKKGNEEASFELEKIDKSTIDYNKDESYNKMFATPSLRKNDHQNLSIKGVEVSSECTAIYFQYTNVANSPYGYYTINKDAYIRDKKTGKKLYLLGTENCRISPLVTNIRLGETASFVLYFPSISQKSNEIDFIESDTLKDGWKVLGIKLKK